jgi:ribosome maturation factor RimP
MTPQEQIRQFLEEILSDSDCFVVDFKVKPTNNFKIFLDSDTGFTLEKSMQINRALRRKSEESGLFPEGDFSLEVSSPGIDAPLKMHRQYLRNIGRKLEIVPVDDDAPGLSGRLLSVNEDGIRLEVTPIRRRGVKPPAEPEVLELPFSQIKSATVQIEF